MKTILHLILTISILTIAISGFVMTDDSGVNRKLNFPSPLDLKTVSKTEKNKVSNDPDLENSDWYSEAMNNLSETEYNITFNEEINSYQSPNRANNMRFIYHKDGFTVEIRDDKIPLFDIKDKSLKEEDKKYEVIETWSFDLRVQDLRRETYNETTAQSLFQNGAPRGVLFSGSEIQATENKAFIEYDNLKIDYTNDKPGMRQDFFIKKRPDGEGKLRLNLSAETKLKMIVGADALMFKDKIGDDKMKYSSLKCWDANGCELRAYFEKNDQLQISNDKLQIENHNSQIRNSKYKDHGVKLR